VVLRGIKLWQVAAQLGVPAASLFARTSQSEDTPDMRNENMVSFFLKKRGYFIKNPLWVLYGITSFKTQRVLYGITSFCGLLLFVRMCDVREG
jgi:hypothetical protein